MGEISEILDRSISGFDFEERCFQSKISGASPVTSASRRNTGAGQLRGAGGQLSLTCGPLKWESVSGHRFKSTPGLPDVGSILRLQC